VGLDVRLGVDARRRYAPAWVYWWYEPGFFGWAPAGYWDCYRPYYNWAYDPYRYSPVTFGAGFYDGSG